MTWQSRYRHTPKELETIREMMGTGGEMELLSHGTHCSLTVSSDTRTRLTLWWDKRRGKAITLLPQLMALCNRLSVRWKGLELGEAKGQVYTRAYIESLPKSATNSDGT